MQRVESLPSLRPFHVKNEVITIDEDEIPVVESKPMLVQQVSLLHNNGEQAANVIYYFEPQQKSNFNVKMEDKSESYKNPYANPVNSNRFYILADTDKQKNAIQILCIDCPPPNEANVFADRPTFEQHYKSTHKEQPVVFACVACDYNAKKFILLRNHFKKHVAKRYECNECSSCYTQKADLNYHKTNIHGRKLCRRCNLEFDSTESLIEHKSSHSGPSGKGKASKTAEKECPDCGKMLQTTGGLFTHRKMHLEKPKYRCETCQKEFFQKVNLVNHEKTHNIQNRNYNCSQCDKSFFEKSHLLRHQNFHSESRDFQCNQCLKFYKTERCLKVHKQVHSDPSNRPFKCDVCAKGFLSSSKLKQHANIHTNSRPYQCKHCPRDFTNYPNLLKHTIRRHKVDHRTGKPLVKIPDYVTNKKKKKSAESIEEITKTEYEMPPSVSQASDQQTNVIQVTDDDLDLPSTSGFRNFQFGEDANYDILMDIDEFSDFQLLSPGKDYDGQEEVNDNEHFSIIDATGKCLNQCPCDFTLISCSILDLQFFANENSINVHMIPSGQ